MADIDIPDLIKRLVALQKVDSQIYQAKKDLKDQPEQLKILQQEFEEKKSAFLEVEEQLKAKQVERKTFEGDLKAKEEDVAKANAQLSQIKTNKEYTAKITEIEGMKADMSIIEEKILASYDETDSLKETAEKEKAVIAEEEKGYLAKKKEVEDAIREEEAKVKELEQQRAALIPGVDTTILKRYERILQNKEGVALVPVQGSSCGGCFMNVPAQVINDMKKHEELIFCEMCARIIYLEEDLA